MAFFEGDSDVEELVDIFGDAKPSWIAIEMGDPLEFLQFFSSDAGCADHVQCVEASPSEGEDGILFSHFHKILYKA